MKMKKSDIGVVVIMYAICAFFYSMCIKLQAGSQTYPMFTIALLFGLTTLYVVKMVIAARKFGTEKGMEAFDGFMPLQFVVSLAMVLGYLFLMNFLGFFVATTLFVIALMLFLKVPKLHILISVVALDLLIYLAFVKFLGVKLPAGLLF